MIQRYNVYFAGQVVDGHDLGSVRKALAQIFNADEHTLNTLLSGKLRLVKRNCDKATALKYQAALLAAGAKPVIRLIEPASNQTAISPQKMQAAPERKSGPDASALRLGSFGQHLSPQRPPMPTMPDTSHLNMLDAGTVIPNLPDTRELVFPNIDDMALSPLDFDFSDCISPKEIPLSHDLRALSLSLTQRKD